MHHLNLSIFIFLISLAAHAHASTLYPISAIKLNDGEKNPLSKDHGYLLIKLDTGGEGPSFHYRQKETWRKKSIKVPLGNLENGYYVLPVKQGDYQITRVDAPHYNLPFYLDIDSIPQWQFTIKAGHLNYIGQLSIEKERSTRHVNINLLNRFAQDYQQIQTAVAPVVEQYPLIINLGYRDDFQQELLEQVSAKPLTEQKATQEGQ